MHLTWRGVAKRGGGTPGGPHVNCEEEKKFSQDNPYHNIALLFYAFYITVSLSSILIF